MKLPITQLGGQKLCSLRLHFSYKLWLQPLKPKEVAIFRSDIHYDHCHCDCDGTSASKFTVVLLQFVQGILCDGDGFVALLLCSIESIIDWTMLSILVGVLFALAEGIQVSWVCDARAMWCWIERSREPQLSNMSFLDMQYRKASTVMIKVESH